MKKYSVVILLAFVFVSQAKAQWNGTNPVYTTANVGIGTTTPTNGKLEIKGTTDAALFYVRQEKNSGGSSNLFYMRDDRGYGGANTGTTFKIDSWKGSGQQGGTLLNFSTIDDGVYKSRFFINNHSGYAGFGTINPLVPLQVDGANGLQSRLRITSPSVGSASASYDIAMGSGSDHYAAGMRVYVPAGQPGIDRVFLGFYTTTFDGSLQSRIERLTINDKGFVGVGTTSPIAQLDVRGASNFQGGRLTHQGDIPNDNNAVFTNNAPTGYGLYSKGGLNTHYSFHFENQVGTSILYGGGNGNIGVRTTTPQAALEVVNTNGFNTGETPASQDNILLSMATPPGTGAYFGPITWKNGGRRRASIAAIQEASDQDFVGLAFFTQGVDGPGGYAESMRIAHNGNIGIGTTAPIARLDVRGASNFQGGRLTQLGDMPNDNNAVFTNTAVTGYGLYSKGGLTTHYSFHFENQAGESIMYGQGNGNVGIGTTTPDAKLAVKGHIHTQEVRVDLLGSVAPDYVFESDYDLSPLSEVESYIKANKHLPEVPSAKEMEAEGLNLKEMNLLLLKKVEELTLHLIDQNKKISDQQLINQMLVNEINNLKKEK